MWWEGGKPPEDLRQFSILELTACGCRLGSQSGFIDHVWLLSALARAVPMANAFTDDPNVAEITPRLRASQCVIVDVLGQPDVYQSGVCLVAPHPVGGPPVACTLAVYPVLFAKTVLASWPHRALSLGTPCQGRTHEEASVISA